MGALYLDASAAVKLIVEEHESAALAAFINDHARRQGPQHSLVSSDLLRTELLAVTGRAGASVDDARTVLRSVHLITLSPAVCDSAGRLAGAVAGPALGSLDAIHLATALTVVTQIDAVLTYDRRLGEITRSMGLEAIGPK